MAFNLTPEALALMMGGTNMMAASRGGSTDLSKGGLGYALQQGLQGGLQGAQLGQQMGQQAQKQKMIDDMLMKLNLSPSAQQSTGVLSPDTQQSALSNLTPEQKEMAKMAIMSGDWKSVMGMMAPEAAMTPYQAQSLKLQQQRLEREGGTRAFQPIQTVDEQGNTQWVMPTFKEGQVGSQSVPLPSGVRSVAETPEMKRMREAETKAKQAGMEATSKGQAQRQQGFIDSGLMAADSMANINRGLDLLNTVETGGFDAAALKARQMFGIEGANEAELSNNLGKAVLSQLRTVFGAAFTAKEGEQLTGIEASFGKSTEGNKRLLEQAKRITERAAKRGIKAARDTGDDQTAQEIEDALKFNLSPKDKASAPKDVPPEVWAVMTPEEKAAWQ